MMKHSHILVVLLIGACLIIPNVSALLNPAVVYCEGLNYTYTVESGEGGDTGYCIVNGGTRIEAWNFLRGEDGVEYGYCEKQGYSTKSVTDPDTCGTIYSDSCAVCVLPDDEEVEVTELMGLSFREPDFVVEDFPASDYAATPTKTPLSAFSPLCALAAVGMLLFFPSGKR